MITRLRSDVGTTAVELAMVVGLILTAGLSAVDVGLWVFQRSEAEQAAREASRVAMIQPPAGMPGPVTVTSGAIFDAARAELDSNLSPHVTVECSGTCTPGQDTITVRVTWDRTALTPLPFIPVLDNIAGASSRTVVGLP